MRHAVVVAAVALALAVAVVLPAAAQQDGAVSIRLLDAPEDRRDDPRARSYIVDHVQPGETIERRVEVGNTTAETRRVQLYVAAADVEDGEFRFGEGRAENDLTDWSTVDPSSVDVPSGASATALVRIDVPVDAVDGERYAVIWAELPGSGGTTNVVNRVGIRIYLSVGDGEEPVVDFAIDTLTAARDAEGRPVVDTAVTNTGGRAIDLSGELLLENGPGSLTAGPFDVEVGTTLAPGDSAPARVVLDPGLPDGPWDAVVRITSGRESREARATITFPSTADTRSQAVPVDDDEQRRLLAPVAAVLVVGGLAGSGVAAARWLGRRRLVP